MSEERCPYVVSGEDGTSYCRIADEAVCKVVDRATQDVGYWRERAEKAESALAQVAKMKPTDAFEAHISTNAMLVERLRESEAVVQAARAYNLACRNWLDLPDRETLIGEALDRLQVAVEKWEAENDNRAG